MRRGFLGLSLGACAWAPSERPKPGAAGVLAVNDLSQVPHDGHALLVGVNSLVIEDPAHRQAQVDVFDSGFDAPFFFESRAFGSSLPP